MNAPMHDWVSVPASQKTALVRQRILEGALHPSVRDVAVRLTQMVARNDHHERISRIHRHVRDNLSYHREPVEQFQSADWTLQHGGDCDCLTIAAGALAWSLRYPFVVQPHGDPDDPEHYSIWIGWPAHDDPWGDRRTTWIHCELSAAAATGERSEEAAQRRAPL